MSELVSIIVPVYNSEDCLSYCVRSLIDQTYINIEILLIENGSVDDSFLLCKEFAEQDKRVKAFHLETANVSGARNFGIQQAKGDFILFADSDDYCSPQWCEELMCSYKQYHGDYVPVCGYTKVSDYNGTLIKEYKLESEKENFILESKDILFLHQLNFLNTPCNKLYEKAIIRNNRILMPVDMSLGEDMVFNINYIQCGSKKGFNIINRGLYYYVRAGKESLDHRYLPAYYFMANKMFDSLYDYCISNKIMLTQSFWHWAFWLYNEVLKNTMHVNNKEPLKKKIATNHAVLCDRKLQLVIFNRKKHIAHAVYWAMRSKSYIFLCIVMAYEDWKEKIRDKFKDSINETSD